jgi:hypothetical protein
MDPAWAASFAPPPDAPPVPLWTRFARWLRRRRIARFELACVAAFHLLVAITIAFAPREQVVTPGTSAIFGTIPLPVWVAWFACTGTAATAAVIRATSLRLALTWMGVFPLGLAWTYGFSAAVTDGRGNAVFALVWPFLLAWWLTLAWRMSFGGSETRWSGG